MTERQKFDITENKVRIYLERHGICEVCGKMISLDTCQLAHRTPKSKRNIKKYGKAFIHSDENLALVCGLDCNARVLLDPASHPVEAEELYRRWRDE